MEALLAKSEGIFLWVSLAIDNLTCFSSGPDFDRFLKKPRLRLEEVYRKMLHAILSRGESGEALNMIWSVALALRPLTFSELAHILACIEERARAEQQLSQKGTNGEISMRTDKEIRIYVRSSLGFLRATTETVSIVHHTAKEYLFDEYGRGGLPVLSKSLANLSVSWGCFRYIHHAFGDPERLPRGGIKCGHDGSSLTQGHQKLEPGGTPWEVARGNPRHAAAKQTYLRYAAESWFIHARRSIEISKDDFCDDLAHNWLNHQFFETSDVVRKPWIELCGDSGMEVLAGERAPLHIAVCLGLMPLVKKTLTDPEQNCNTPLHEEGISGHSSVLETLEKESAGYRVYSNEINKRNDSGSTPLHLAFQFDHTEIVEHLLKKGADTTIKNNAQMTPLELGVKLKRGDTLGVLKQVEETRKQGGTAAVEEPLIKESLEEPLEEPVEELVEELEQNHRPCLRRRLFPELPPAPSPELRLLSPRDPQFPEPCLASLPKPRSPSPVESPQSSPQASWFLIRQESWFLSSRVLEVVLLAILAILPLFR